MVLLKEGRKEEVAGKREGEEAVMAMASGMRDPEARWEQAEVWRMDGWGGGVKCSGGGVKPSLSLVAASLSAV